MAAIAVHDVAIIFDEARICELAAIGKLPRDADIAAFGREIREAAVEYSRATRTATNNQVHNQVRNLFKAASRLRYDELASLLDELSPETSALLNNRGQLPSFGIALPQAQHLREIKTRDEASEAIISLCTSGARIVDGRVRSGGRRSRRTITAVLYTQPQRSPLKRGVERSFVISLQRAWLRATGELPSLSANHAKIGPFARLVTECLRVVGAPHADAVQLINDLNEKRRQAKAMSRQRFLSTINT